MNIYMSCVVRGA